MDYSYLEMESIKLKPNQTIPNPMQIKLRCNKYYKNLKIEILDLDNNLSEDILLDDISILYIINHNSIVIPTDISHFANIGMNFVSLNLCILLSNKINIGRVIPLSVYNLIYHNNYPKHDATIDIRTLNNNLNITYDQIKTTKKLYFNKYHKLYEFTHLSTFFSKLNKPININFVSIANSYTKIIGIIFELILDNSKEIHFFDKIDQIKINSDNGKTHIFFDDLGDIKKKVIGRSYFLTIFFDDNYDNIIDVLKNKIHAKGITCSELIEIKLLINRVSTNVDNNFTIYIFNSHTRINKINKINK